LQSLHFGIDQGKDSQVLHIAPSLSLSRDISAQAPKELGCLEKRSMIDFESHPLIMQFTEFRVRVIIRFITLWRHCLARVRCSRVLDPTYQLVVRTTFQPTAVLARPFALSLAGRLISHAANAQGPERRNQRAQAICSPSEFRTAAQSY
jgi:hypothetical protein